MDLQGALSALMRQPTATSSLSTTFPFSAFMHHPLMSSLSFPLSTGIDSSLFGITAAEPQPAVTPKKARLDSPCSPLSQSSTVSSSQVCSPQPSPARKLAQPIPDERKDEAYYERRKRNNDAAKRSRDARRQKEEAVAERAAQLERENGQLRGQVTLLKSETARLQLLLISRQQLAAAAAAGVKSDVNQECLDVLLQNCRTTVLANKVGIHSEEGV